MAIPITPIYKGTIATVRGTFKNKAGVNSDPSTVTLKMFKPDGNVATHTSFSNPGVGIYDKDITFDIDGDWIAQFSSSGDPTVVDEETIRVRPIKSA